LDFALTKVRAFAWSSIETASGRDLREQPPVSNSQVPATLRLAAADAGMDDATWGRPRSHAAPPPRRRRRRARDTISPGIRRARRSTTTARETTSSRSAAPRVPGRNELAVLRSVSASSLLAASDSAAEGRIDPGPALSACTQPSWRAPGRANLMLRYGDESHAAAQPRLNKS